MIKRIFLEGNAKPLIKNLIIHHSAGSACENWKISRVKQSLSNVGFNRGYKKWGYDKITGNQKAWNCSECKTVNYKGSLKCSNCGKIKSWEPLKIIGHNPLTDPQTRMPTYAMYHFCIYKYNLDQNKYGYKFINLILKPLYYDSGSTKTLKTNQVSIALCFLGNYKHKQIDTRALECASENLKWVIDYTGRKLNIIGHKDIQRTACPGRIYEQLDVLKKLLGVQSV